MSLPLREYYPIKRAAELLGVTIDDLIHWAMVGCIRVYTKIDHAYGRIPDKWLDEFDSIQDFDAVIKDTPYDEILKSLNSNVSEGIGEEGYDYYLERAKIIHQAMSVYARNHGGAECFNKIGLRKDFAYFNYLFYSRVEERFCSIKGNGLFPTALEIDCDEYQKIIKNVPVDVRPFIVSMRGFFGLGETFFSGYDFCNKFKVNRNGDDLNAVFMPESDLQVMVISDDELIFECEDLFVFKCDVIAIYESLKNGTELNKKYHLCNLKNEFEWWKLIGAGVKGEEFDSAKNNKLHAGRINHLLMSRKPHISEMHASKRESVLKAAIYMKINHPDLCDNNTKWSEAINDYAHKFWADGKCPLSLEVTAKLLGKALNPTK